MKSLLIALFAFGFLILSSCSPKTSQPCPHVYKMQKNQINNANADVLVSSIDDKE